MALASYIKEESSPDAFLTELKELAAYCEQWWENRTKREGIHPHALNDHGFQRGLTNPTKVHKSRLIHVCILHIALTRT